MRQSGRQHIFTDKSEAWNKAFSEFIHSRQFYGAPKSDDLMWVTFGDDTLEEFTFEIDMKFNRNNAVTCDAKALYC